MDALKRLFGKEDMYGDSLHVEADDNIHVDIKAYGVLPYTSSSVFITCFPKKNGKVVQNPLAVKFAWSRQVGKYKYAFENNRGSYFLTATDMFSKLVVEITSLESDSPGSAKVTIGPVLLDPNLKMDLYDIASSSDGIRIPLMSCEPGRETDGRISNNIQKPVLYLFETYFKIVAQSSTGLKSVRANYRDGFDLMPTHRGANFLNLAIDDERIQEFFSTSYTDLKGIDMEFESTQFRDRALISVKIYSVIASLRNELILQKILPHISENRAEFDSKAAELIGMNESLTKELNRLYTDYEKLNAKYRELDEKFSLVTNGGSAAAIMLDQSRPWMTKAKVSNNDGYFGGSPAPQRHRMNTNPDASFSQDRLDDSRLSVGLEIPPEINMSNQDLYSS